MSEFESIRKRAGWSREKAAVTAGVSYPTARLFESAGPDAVKNPEKRQSLIDTYDHMRSLAKASETRVDP